MVDPDAAVDSMVEFSRDFLEESPADGYVLGVSGGLDSVLVLELAVRAVGADRIVGLVMPGSPSAAEHMRDARTACRDRDVAFLEYDIEPVVSSISSVVDVDINRTALGNVRARTRMVLEYLVANQCEGVVIGTTNKSERMLGYFTKYGDGAVDCNPMAELYKTEVTDVARAVDLDTRFIEKTPTAELWEGQTDVDELGADYDTIDEILKRLLEDGWSPERIATETEYDRTLIDRFVAMHRRSAHKRSRPATACIHR